MIYTVPFHGVALSATAGTFKTVAGILVPLGARCAVVRIFVGPADAQADDRDLVAKVGRSTTNIGTPGTSLAVTDISKSDPAGRNPLCTAGLNYSGEPTGLETYGPFTGGMNDRGGIDYTFMSEDQEPKLVGIGTTPILTIIALLVTAMRSNATQSVVSGHVAFREY